MRAWQKVSLGAGGAVVAVLALGMATVDTWAEPLIEARLESRLDGRTVEIGDLTTDWDGARVTLTAQDVRIANPEWAKEPWLVAAPRVTGTVDWTSWFDDGPMRVDSLSVERPKLWLARSGDGRATWSFGRDRAERGGWGAQIARVTLSEAAFTYLAPAQGIELTGTLGSREDGASLAVEASGTYTGGDMTVSGRVGGLHDLMTAGNAYPVDLDVRRGETAIRAEGTVTWVDRIRALDLTLRGHGPDLRDLEALFATELPVAEAWSARLRLGYDGDTWSLTDLRAEVGESRGRGRLDWIGPEGLLRGELDFAVLRLADLPLGGAGGHRGPPRLDLRIDAAEVRGAPLEVGSASAHVTLRDGVLTLDDLNGTVAHGGVAGSARAELTARPPQVSATLDLADVRLEPLVGPDLASHVSGRFGGRLEASAAGATRQALLGSLEGRAGLVITDGSLDDVGLDAAMLGLRDLAGLVVARNSPTTAVRCGMLGLDVTEGRGRVTSFLLETGVARLTGSGTVAFDRRRLDLLIGIRPLGPNLMTLADAVAIRGAWDDPSVSVSDAAPPPAGLADATRGLGPFGGAAGVVGLGLGSEPGSCADLVRRVEESAMALPEEEPR